MNEIAPLDAAHAPVLTRPFFDPAAPSPIVGLLAYVPELLEAALPFVATVFGPTSIPDRFKEIVILRVSAIHGCRYCLRTHRALALEAGLSAQEASEVIEGHTAPSFDTVDAALLAFADGLCERPGEALASLRPHFPEHQQVELTVLGTATIFLNHFCIAMGLR